MVHHWNSGSTTRLAADYDNPSWLRVLVWYQVTVGRQPARPNALI